MKPGENGSCFETFRQGTAYEYSPGMTVTEMDNLVVMNPVSLLEKAPRVF